MEWFYHDGQKEVGPVDEDQLRQLAEDGLVERDTPVWNSEIDDWTEAGQTELRELFKASPPKFKKSTAGAAGAATPKPAPRELGEVAYSIHRKWELALYLLGAGIVLVFFFDIAVLLLVSAFVFLMMCLYGCWKSVPEDLASVTPRNAVSGLMLPFYNCYWVFRAYWGLAKDINKANAAKELQPAVNEKLALAATIAGACWPLSISLFGIPSLVHLVLVFIVLRQCINAINDLQEAAD